MQTARVSNSAFASVVHLATTVKNAKNEEEQRREGERGGIFMAAIRSGTEVAGRWREGGREGGRTMSNRTNIDLGTFYCPTARARAPIDTTKSCMRFHRCCIPFPRPRSVRLCRRRHCLPHFGEIVPQFAHIHHHEAVAAARVVRWRRGGSAGHAAGRPDREGLSLKLLFLCPTNEATNEQRLLNDDDPLLFLGGGGGAAQERRTRMKEFH